MKNKTIYFAIIFVLFVSLGIFGLQKDNIAKAQTITFKSNDYTANFNVYLNGSRYSRGETASASIGIYIVTNSDSEDVFSGTVTIAGKKYYFFSYVPVYSLKGYYQVSAPVETTSGDYNATFAIARNGRQDTQQVMIPYNVYALTNWSSSDSSIVTVNNNGYAEAKAAGQAKITVTYKDKVAYLNIVVLPAHIVLAPTAFTFTGISGGATPAGQTLNIKNTGGATLGWSGVTSQGWCHISAGSGSLAADASQNITVTVDPPSNVGSFDCAIGISDPNADNSPQTASATYTVSPSPPGSFNLSLGGGGAAACNSVPLSWTASSGANAYRILRGSPRVDISPYQPYTALNFTDTTVSQNTTYAYQIEAYNSAGTNRSNEISVPTPYCPPVINFSANPTDIFQGQSATLSWATYYTTSCTASGKWSGPKATNNSIGEVVIPSPPPSATYNLTCSGPGGSTTQSVTIKITSLPNWREIIPR